MTPAQLDHLRRIDAHLANLLSTAEKRTPGEYIKRGTYVGSKDSHRGVADCCYYGYAENEDNAAFIASCAGNAEAGWRATRSAIAEILSAHEAAYEGWCLVAKELGKDPGQLEDYPLPPWSQHILAAFPNV